MRVLNTEINKLLKLQDLRSKFQAEGGDAMGSTPEQFGELLKVDIAKWGRVVRDSGAKVD
jgi:tripartite-type tricarboxylate transporter receptor subunit TctC